MKKLKRKRRRRSTSDDYDETNEILQTAREKKRRRKEGRRLRFAPRFDLDSQHTATWITQRLRDPNNPAEIKYWGVEIEANRPPRRTLKNGDFSPEDWIWNPPDPKPTRYTNEHGFQPASRIAPINRSLRRILGYPRFLTAANSASAPIDWKAHLLASEKASMDLKKPWAEIGSYTPVASKPAPKRSKAYVKSVKRQTNYVAVEDFQKYVFTNALGVRWYYPTKKAALEDVARNFPDGRCEGGSLASSNRAWKIKFKKGRYRLFKA